MKYLAERTSQTYLDSLINPPCKGAEKVSFGRAQIWNGEEGDEIVQWVVEIPDLIKFVQENGQVIVAWNESLKMPEIEIYDYYRE